MLWDLLRAMLQATEVPLHEPCYGRSCRQGCDCTCGTGEPYRCECLQRAPIEPIEWVPRKVRRGYVSLPVEPGMD